MPSSSAFTRLRASTAGLTDKGDLVARPASKVTGPHVQVSGLPKGKEKFMLESLFATLAAKIAAGVIAAVVAATGGLAGTGNLPDPAQTAVSQALSNIGVDIPSGADADEAAAEALELAEEAAAEALEKAQEAADVDETSDAEDEGTGEPNENAAFGQSVAADAKDGGVDGQEISARARARAEERKAAGQANRPDAGTTSVDADASVDAGPPADAGAQGQIGLDIARNTPAGSNVPAGAGRPAGTPGR
jgi:hypothetical protein